MLEAIVRLYIHQLNSSSISFVTWPKNLAQTNLIANQK
jgi:hypothetical protein